VDKNHHHSVAEGCAGGSGGGGVAGAADAAGAVAVAVALTVAAVAVASFLLVSGVGTLCPGGLAVVS